MLREVLRSKEMDESERNSISDSKIFRIYET